MKVVRFEFSEGSRFQKGASHDANGVGQYLELLCQQVKGELTAVDVVDDARNKNSPLHGFFEWDDGLAAEQYRLGQARGLIRSVVAIYRPVENEKSTIATKAFVHVPERGASHYRATHEALAVRSTRDMVLQSAWNELQQWRRRYKDLQQFAALFDAIDKIEIGIKSQV